MADENTEQAPQGQEAREDAGGGLVKKLFAKKAEAANDRRPPEQGVAHIPATVLTVEYVDDSEGMDAALKDMGERLAKVDQQVGAMQETQTQLVAAVNQQARDIAKYIESIGRRVDRLYRRATGGEPVAARRPELSAMDEDIQDAANLLDEPAALTGSAGVAPEVADDPDHQNAWRIARVLAADLESYHEDAVKEGVLYGTFYKLLKDPIGKARQTYRQRVSQELVENYDYFSKALDELIARKRMELEDEEQT